MEYQNNNPEDGSSGITPGDSLKSAVRESIRRGVEFLSGSQDSTGEIPVCCSCDRELTERKRDSNTFGTVQMLHSLAGIEHPDACVILERASTFVLSRMETPGIWRYWTDRPIPPDLDDTACASVLLMVRHPLLILRANLPLILENRDRRGLFRTWIGSEDNDVDCVVNANVVWYLGENESTRAAVRWVDEIIRTGQEDESCWYYEDPLALYYALSRAVRSGIRKWRPLGEIILERIDRRFHSAERLASPLLKAQALCTLSNLGFSGSPLALEIGVELLSAQDKNGAWAACPAWNGPRAPAPRSVWWGSEELTTAICLEALSWLL